MDGIVSNYFEWMGAGFYRPVHRDAAMHGRRPFLSQIFYGRDAEHFFLRVDFHDRTVVTPERIQLRVGFREEAGSAVIVSLRRSDPGKGIQCEIRLEEKTPAGPSVEAALGQAAFEKIFELRLSLCALGLPADRPLEFQVTLWESNLPVETLPLEGWLTAPA
jgi:hypothetical protein